MSDSTPTNTAPLWGGIAVAIVLAGISGVTQLNQSNQMGVMSDQLVAMTTSLNQLEEQAKAKEEDVEKAKQKMRMIQQQKQAAPSAANAVSGPAKRKMQNVAKVKAFITAEGIDEATAAEIEVVLNESVVRVKEIAEGVKSKTMNPDERKLEMQVAQEERIEALTELLGFELADKLEKILTTPSSVAQGHTAARPGSRLPR